MHSCLPVWEDREIKFDIPNMQNNLRGGEKSLSFINNVEDNKGNPGDTGNLLITNLRIIWYSLVNKKFNISIGFLKIISMTTKSVFSKQRGTTQALHVVAAGASMKFEFLFLDCSAENKNKAHSPFESVFDLYRIYQQTPLYRELKLRGHIVQQGNIIVLPQEQVYTTVHGVWNLSSDQGNLGSFVVTNVRLVWFADVNETFNLSLPYMQISYIKLRDSKYGLALVIHTLETGGSYVLGFRIDPQEKLQEIYKELISLHSVYKENPNFGVEYKVQKHTVAHNEGQSDLVIENIQEIDDKQEKEINSKLNSYIAEGTSLTNSKPREPFYCKEIGFAMEKLRNEFKPSDLWDVVSSEKI
ncbi:Bardet-Biedl syndrome 5 protein homolog [Condylostylus longicornis]|uniref:Bardet-Biedl syndrome 5 protein homolog n=1 Tax=Condylostylus longicornis TaxID=2530218 RepID=UPI00244E319F|nr:Bardet-Biedl syndrome 5 protein homolog [Condylostylus longicornis]